MEGYYLYWTEMEINIPFSYRKSKIKELMTSE